MQKYILISRLALVYSPLTNKKFTEKLDLVKEELDKLIAEGHVVRETQVGEDQFISPVVITRKHNGTVKVAVDATELNDNIT